MDPDPLLARRCGSARSNKRRVLMSEQVKGIGRPTLPPSPYQIQVSYGADQPILSSGISRGTGADWFGPLNPLTPIAPPDVAGRRFDFPPGYNIVTRPRAYEPIGFHELRAFADSYDLLRLVIETRKDQMERQRWRIRPRAQAPTIPRSRGRNGWGRSGAAFDADTHARVIAVEHFFHKPDGVTRWKTWLRALLEDMFVIDAATLYCQRTRSGQLFALQQLDGATIKRVIDDWGRTPQPYRNPSPLPLAGEGMGGGMDLSAGLSAGAQRPAGRQLFGARYHLSAAQCAGSPGLRLFAGAAGADDGQHRAAPAALAARLLLRRLDPRRADRRAAGLDAGPDQAVPGLLGHRVLRRPRQAPPRQIRARRYRGEGGADQRAAAQGRFRRMARPHHLLCLFGAAAMGHQSDEPRHRRQPIGAEPRRRASSRPKSGSRT